MKKSAKIAIIVAVIMIISGAAISVCAYGAMDVNYFEGMEIETVYLKDDFSSVDISLDMCEVWVFSAEDNLRRIEYSVFGDVEISTEVVGEVLKISAPEREWYDYISIVHFRAPRVSIYLPPQEYKDFKLNLSGGDVYVPSKISFENVNIKTTSADIQFYGEATGSLSLESTSGDITISDTNLNLNKVSLKTTSGDIKANGITASSDINIKTASGDVEANSIIASSEIKIKTTSGDIEFASIDAPRIDLEAVSGDIEGTVLTKKRINADTTSGDINVRSYDSAKEICNASTVSGDIEIKIR